MSNRKTNIREENNKLVTECRQLFWDLIDLTGTYFLSDCVEESSGSMPDVLHKEFIKKRDHLNLECSKRGINFHQISQDVAQEFLSSQKPELTVKQVISGLIKFRNAKVNESDWDLINQAISLIGTHCIED